MAKDGLQSVSCALSFDGMEDFLNDELRRRFDYVGETTRHGLLFCFDTCPWGEQLPYWASTVMRHPAVAHFSSINEAASILRGIQRNWYPYSALLFRRTALIQERLPHINCKPRTFPAVIPATSMGLFTLLDKNTMLFSPDTTSPLPCGILSFVEDHVNPPSRAYLKLQEALTIAHIRQGSPMPSAGAKCFDAGASPGGWTWVLAGQGCDVFAVDRAPLAPSLLNHPLVTFRKHDAFTIPIEEIVETLGCEKCDWVCSDVACYPERLLPWIQMWIDSGKTSNMICTIKVQGLIDYALISEFASLPHSIVVHLNANKHELTFIYAAVRASAHVNPSNRQTSGVAALYAAVRASAHVNPSNRQTSVEAYHS